MYIDIGIEFAKNNDWFDFEFTHHEFTVHKIFYVRTKYSR